MRTTGIGVDLKLFGTACLIVGMVERVMITLLPAYEQHLFGAASFLIELHAPAAQLVTGYGLLWLRPWVWGLSLAYAGCGIVGEALNQLAFGVHIARSGFMAATAWFMVYLFWRRRLFADPAVVATPGPSWSEGSH